MSRMSRSAARESRQIQRLCETCRQRKARYRFRDRGRADRPHTLCFACCRSLRDRQQARSHVDRPAIRGVVARFELTRNVPYPQTR